MRLRSRRHFSRRPLRRGPRRRRRDLTAGQFKCRTTAGGQRPTDDDLFRTISRGANGTGMPPWKYLLTDDERWALVEYVKTFDPRFANARALKPMPLPDAPGKSRDAVH